MELRRKLEEILAKDYGITSEAQFLEEYQKMERVDLSIFTGKKLDSMSA